MKKPFYLLFIYYWSLFGCVTNDPFSDAVNSSVTPIVPDVVVIDRDLTFTYMETYKFHPVSIDTAVVMTVKPFAICKYELTNEEYHRFIMDGGHENPYFWSELGWKYSGGRLPENWSETEIPYKNDPRSFLPDTPVVGLSYYEAEAYCKWLSIKTGERYYVPSAAEWQRAAKGPDPGRVFVYGNEWVDGISYFFSLNAPFYVPVYNIKANRSYDGCYHMIGNAYELTLPVLEKWRKRRKGLDPDSEVGICQVFCFYMYSERNSIHVYNRSAICSGNQAQDTQWFRTGVRLCKKVY